MPRRSNFKYQIDRRRSKKISEIDQQEDAYIHANDDEPRENEDDEDYEESNDDESEDDTKSTTTSRKEVASSARKVRQDVKKDASSEDSEVDGNTQGDSGDDEEEDYQPKPRTTSSRNRSSTKNPHKNEDGTSSESEPEWPEEKDDLDDEDFVPSSKGNSKRKAQASSSEEDDDNFVVDDDDDVVEFKSVKTRRRNVTKKSHPPSKRPRADDLDEELDEVLDGDVTFTSNSRRRGRPKATSRTRGKKKDYNDDDEHTSSQPARLTRSRRVSSTFKRTSYKEVDSDDGDDDSEGSNEGISIVPKSRPSRCAASRATKKLEELKDTLYEKESQDDDQEEDSDQEKPYVSPSKKLSSDEEFLADSASENSDEKEIFYTDSEDDGQEESHHASAKPKPVNIDNEDIGSAGDSSGDDNVLANGRPKQNPTSSQPSEPKEIQPVSHDAQYSTNDSSEDEDAALFFSAPKLPECPSIEDAITLEPLPKIHVCYVSPDGQSRQCFSIETLRQIALKCEHLPFRVDLDGSSKDTFLQPPHFRTAMSDDLLDQIASRFGREALNLYGDFYNRKPQDKMRTSMINDEDYGDYENIFGTGVQQFGEEFIDRVQKYMTNQMGSRDVYACPLCYSEMHRRIVRMDAEKPGYRRNRNDDDGDGTDDEEFLQLPPDSMYDPMTVLGWLDDDRFEASSCFCFGKVVELKQHLRDDHAVATKGIQGNDLYHRFRVRGQDGLLQRYLHNQLKRLHSTSFQGAMQQYWFQGNNQSFVYLLEMIKRARVFIDVLKAGDAEEDDLNEAEKYLKVGNIFFHSFQNRAHLEWEQISSPFSKSTQKDDLRDFLADDDAELQNQDETQHFLAQRQLHEDDDSDPNDLVNRLQRKYGEKKDSESSSGDDDSVAASDSADNNGEDEAISVTSDLNRNGFYSSEDEDDEKDEWIKGIRSKRKLKQSPKTRKARASQQSEQTTPQVRKLTRRKPTTPLSAAAIASLPSPASKRRSIAEESSSDELISDA